jgi:hypothetical protein
MQFPRRLVLKPSPSLALLLALMLLAALGSLVPLDIPLWMKLAGAGAAAISSGTAMRRHAFLAAKGATRELILHEDGTVEAARADPDIISAGVSSQSTVFPWLVVLLLEVPGSRTLFPVLILRDSLSPEEFRVLQAWLRWKAGKGATAA